MKNILIFFALVFSFSLKAQVFNLKTPGNILNLDETNFQGLGQQPYVYEDTSPYYQATTILIKDVFKPIKSQLSSTLLNNREIFVALLVKKNGKPHKVFYKLSGDFNTSDENLIENSFQNVFSKITFGNPTRSYNVVQKATFNQ